jgi:glycogen debranching enzyme
MATRKAGPASAVARRGQQQRKLGVLSHAQAATFHGIADAVVAKNGEPFLICPKDGQLPIGETHPFGLYFHDTRYLDGYELRVAGARPMPLAASEAAGTEVLLSLTNPELRPRGGRLVEKDSLDLTWRRQLGQAGPVLRDEIRLRNYSAAAARLPLDMQFATSFEDIFCVRGLLRERPGKLLAPRWRAGRLEFAYNGADRVKRWLRLSFDPPPSRRSRTAVKWQLDIPGRDEVVVRVTAEIEEHPLRHARPADHRDAGRPGPDTARASTTRDDIRVPERTWIGGGQWQTSVRTSSLSLASVLARSLHDLEILCAGIGGRRYYTGGVPWFATIFARDSILSALQTLAFDTTVAADTLRLLAARQGKRIDPWRDEQPGKIMHELRIGELARLDEIPHTPSYACADSTALFLILLGRHAAWTGSLDLFEELRQPVERALGWLDEHADGDGDGLLDYDSPVAADGRLINQGWKDSGDAMVTADGSPAAPPIALVELQAYAYRAWLEMADLFERAGDDGRVASLRRRADGIRARFEEHFWSGDLGCYVMALAGPEHEPLVVVSSNAGHALWSGIARDNRAELVMRRLMAPDMFNGWGTRTLSADAVGYEPISYHRGTVWPHDSAMIAAGFRRYGFDEAAEAIFAGLLEAAEDFPHARLPECLAGHGRGEFGHPVRYPIACHPQAWAAGSIPYLLTTTLGLSPEAFDRRLRVIRPRLPHFVEDVELRDLRVGQATVSLRFRRQGGEMRVEVGDQDGDLEVKVE